MACFCDGTKDKRQGKHHVKMRDKNKGRWKLHCLDEDT